MRHVIARKAGDENRLTLSERMLMEETYILLAGLLAHMRGEKPDFTPAHIRRQRANIAEWEARRAAQ